MWYAASWDEMSLPEPPWPKYRWQWNKAINNTATPDAAWLPFYQGSWTVPVFSGPAKLRMAFQNRGVPQSGYWIISWDDIVVQGTLADCKGPVTSNVVMTPVFLNGPATLTATVDDTTTGGSNIASAEYSLNGGAWTPMSAVDGAFDAVVENVTADFTAVQIGNNAACVRGTDALGNGGAETCQTFVVGYVFTGFSQPIDNLAVNSAKAGQTIPAKWRLTDYNGVPISDPTSFDTLSSYQVICGSSSFERTDAIEIYSGSSGLQYLGDGYWQFNWKTPKTYANSCRKMYVQFQGGFKSLEVYFKFKP
jgi:hypothetical protein